MAFVQREILDGFFTADGGQNTGLEPLLLKKNTLARLINGTVRGGFVSNRPKFRKIILDYGGSSTFDLFTSDGLYQRGTYYKPDFDPEGLVISVSGRLFQITPASISASIVERTIPGDPNPASTPLHWLWQSENYVIDQDGQSYPIFFDGNGSRRSLSDQAILGTTNADFNVPTIGQTVPVTLVSPFTGVIGQRVLINGASYDVVPSVAATATMANITDTAGTLYPIGTQIYADPYFVGPLSRQTVFGPGVTPFHWTSPAGFDYFNLLPTYPIMPVNTIFKVNSTLNVEYQFKVVQVNNPGASVPGTIGYRIQTQSAVPNGTTFATGAIVRKVGPVLPATVVATLALPYTSPAKGSSSTATLVVDYTGPAGQPVTLGTGTYFITASGPAPTGSITLRNVNDSPSGAARLAPLNLLSVPELPPGRMGTYGMGRNWMSLTDGRRFMAGDIVGGSSGTLALQYRDSVLKNQENIYLAGGGFFTVPGSIGEIRFMKFVATLDKSLGQGALQVGTPTSVFSVNTPVLRADWQDVTNPILTQSVISNGGLGQDNTINANSDLLMRSVDGSRSLILARRDFASWGNVPISREVSDILDADDVSLLQYGSAVQFQNRKLETAHPIQADKGVYHDKLIALNYDPVSSLRGKGESVYDGSWTGLNILQLFRGQFTGVERCFAICLSTDLTDIELWEILPDNAPMLPTDTIPISTVFETPALLGNQKDKTMFDLCRLQYGEIYIRDVVGLVHFNVEYRHDFDLTWIPWHSFDVKGGTVANPRQYPALSIGEPSGTPCDTVTNMPYREGYHFQARVTMTVEGGGTCKFMGARFRAITIPQPKDLEPYGCPVTVVTRPAIIYWNAEQTATCPVDTTGEPVVIPAHTYPGATQKLADQSAIAAAEAMLVCTGDGCAPTAWWKMEELLQDNRVDAINAVELAANVVGPPGKSNILNDDGKIGQAVKFVADGGAAEPLSQAYLSGGTGEPALANLGTGWTITGWFKISDHQLETPTGNFTANFVTYTSDGIVQFLLTKETLVPADPSTLTLTLLPDAGPTLTVSFEFDPVINDWYFFRIWHDPDTGKIGVQINDGAKTESADTHAPVASPCAGWTMGAGPITVDSSWGCIFLMDEVNFSPCLLSDEATTFLYNAGAGQTWPVALP